MNRLHSFINKKFSTFRSKLTVAFIFTSMIPLLLSITIAMSIINNHLEKEFQNQLMSDSILRIQQLENRLEQIVNMQSSLSSSFYTTLTPDNAEKDFSSLSLSRFMSLRSNITSLEYVYPFQKIRIYSDYFPFTSGDNIHFFPLSNLTPEILHTVSLKPFNLNKLDFLFSSDDTCPQTVSFHQTLRNISGNIITIYFIDFELSRVMKDIFSQDSSDISVAIILPESGILYESSGSINYPDKYSCFNQVYTLGSRYQLLLKSSYTDWYYLFESSPVSFVSVNHALFFSYLMVFSFTVLICIIAIMIFPNALSKRIRHFSETLNNIPEEALISPTKNPLDELINSPNPKDEIDDIIMGFYNLFEKNAQLNASIRNHEIEMEKSKFTILQEQINPHFLYNSLDTILICMLMDKKETACNLIKSLSHFYRISLSKGKDILSIKQELEMIESYLEIECVGYDEKIQWHINCEKAFSDAGIPKFTLQPIVENSILHGNFTITGQDLRVLIDVTCSDMIQITVSDNGPGIESTRLEEINKILSSENLNPAIGYGLQNCCQRIRLYFGPAYGIRIQSTDQGTQTIVTLPAIAP